MAIQLQLQRRNFGLLPSDSTPADQFHQLFHPNHHPLQPGNAQSSSDDLHTLSFLPEMSTDQIDRLIRLQSERFRVLLHHKINQEIGVLLNQIETRTRVLFQQKDEEIANANVRKIHLEQLLTRLQMENQERKRAVQENQAMVASLSHALNQIRERLSSCANDAESNNNNNRDGEDDAIDYGKKRKTKKMMMICQICNSRISCVLLLPCRHLCSCKPCESTLEFCPVCNTTKKASIEAVIF
ncbi:probable BOI-related E3 ubiquitin-protein ligase 3 [Benincasa hispida]|uniref:probable BOI-related E3 ubiquitin-protein ligase 3 n=1 Tax=Benincasa hispida TaxID=102211 RepID=UPI00190171B3|nr:probable BOI-related E3 ubiquitin-protein ligase 3 [Benincasa hispida]